MVSSFSCGSWCCLPPDLNVLAPLLSGADGLDPGKCSEKRSLLRFLCKNGWLVFITFSDHLPILSDWSQLPQCELTYRDAHEKNRVLHSMTAGHWRLLQTTLEVSKRAFYNWSLLSDNPSWHLVQNPKPEERVSMHPDPGPEVNCVTQMFLVWNHEVRANYYRTCGYMCFHVWQHTVCWILYCTVVGSIHLSEWKEKPLDDVGNGSEEHFEMILRQGIHTCKVRTQHWHKRIMSAD